VHADRPDDVPYVLPHKGRDPTLADSILDRLGHSAHRLTLAGESMRKRQNGLTGKEVSE
jgi:DNA replication protein DnaC